MFSFSFRLAAVTSAVACCLSAHAESGTVVASLNEVQVTAGRNEQPVSDVLSDVSIITREEIERSGATTLADVLGRAPGVEFVRNGGPGGTTSLFMRGGETRFTTLLIDGMRVDSQATGGASWNAIPCGQIERIEIVRGAASALYGSDAVTGVIQVFTRKGAPGFSPAVEVGLGSYGTRKTAVSVSGGTGALDLFVAAERQSSHGFNAINNPANSSWVPDRDGYVQQSASAGLGLQINKAHRVELNLLYSNLDAQYDAYQSTWDDHSEARLNSATLRWLAQWSDNWRSQLMLGSSQERYQTRPSPYLTKTHLNTFSWQNDWTLGAHSLQAVLERKEDQLDNSGTGPLPRSRSQNSMALGYTYRHAAHVLQLNLRNDEDSEFGSETTSGVAYAYRLTPQWRLTAGTGTSFRAPTLYQRFSAYGQSGLAPESGINRELGVAYDGGVYHASVVLYRNPIKNLITFGAPGVCSDSYGCFRNTGNAMLSGVTLSARGVTGDARWSASMDLQDPRDVALDRRLRRRSASNLKLTASQPLWGGRWGADLQFTGQRYENASNTQVLRGYALLGIDASYALSGNWTLLARLDNATNARYELAKDYATPGRSLYVGLKWALK
jgi:vitamin B12 transporter